MVRKKFHETARMLALRYLDTFSQLASLLEPISTAQRSWITKPLWTKPQRGLLHLILTKDPHICTQKRSHRIEVESSYPRKTYETGYR